MCKFALDNFNEIFLNGLPWLGPIVREDNFLIAAGMRTTLE